MVKLGPFLAKAEDNNGSRLLGRAEDRVVQGWRVALSRQFELAGKSGARYRYTAFEEDRFLPPAGANFVIAKLTKDGPTVVYAGETDRLIAMAGEVWGMTTSALNVALAVGKPIRSFQIGRNANGERASTTATPRFSRA